MLQLVLQRVDVVDEVSTTTVAAAAVSREGGGGRSKPVDGELGHVRHDVVQRRGRMTVEDFEEIRLSRRQVGHHRIHEETRRGMMGGDLFFV